MGLIQTPDQLRFSYLAVIEGINRAATLNGSAVSFFVTDIKKLFGGLWCSKKIFFFYQQEDDEENEDEEISDEEAPPLPPPRGESLGRSRSNIVPNNESNSTSVNNVEHRRWVVEILNFFFFSSFKRQGEGARPCPRFLKNAFLPLLKPSELL